MAEPNPQPTNPIPQSTEAFGTAPQPSEAFGNVPKPAEPFRIIPNASESFGSIPRTSEDFRTPPPVRRENCTLTVREVARLFEAGGVARSERSITNWCQANRQGIARLEAYYDPNERRYFITPQSVEAVIAEEKAKAAKTNAEPLPHPAEEFRTETSKGSEAFRAIPEASGDKSDAIANRALDELQKEITDLKITNRGKDYFIEQMKSERESLLKQLVDSSQRVGQLEFKLMRLTAPDDETSGPRLASTDEANSSQ